MSGPKRSDVESRLHITEQLISQQMEKIEQYNESAQAMANDGNFQARLNEAEEKIAKSGDSDNAKLLKEVKDLYAKFNKKKSDAENLSSSAQSDIQKVRKEANAIKDLLVSGAYFSNATQYNKVGELNRLARQSLEDYNNAYNLTLDAVDIKRKMESKLSQAIDRQKKNAANQYLDSALDEVKDIQIDKLQKWTHKGDEAEAALQDINDARDLIADGKYEQAEQAIDKNLKTLRDLHKEMLDNLYKASQQRAKAKAIINALKANYYKDPEVYFPEDEDGNDDVLKPLTIYAEGQGANSLNVEIRLDMNEGDMKLEYYRRDADGNKQDITEADEKSCKQNLDALKEGLAKEGFDTPNTDYGRGAKWGKATPEKKKTVTKTTTHTHVGGKN